MSAIFGFLLIILVIILVVVFSVVGGVLRLLFGFGRKSGYGKTRKEDEPVYQHNDHNTTRTNNNSSNNQKIFDDDEGEYVDFEEIKENKEESR